MEELHYVAANLNWDNGLESPAAILNHPLCDAGTALLLYWYGQGFFHSNPADAEPEEKALFDRLITRFSQGISPAIASLLMPSKKTCCRL
ncbi:DUF4274 domain-containing protein [Shewanella sp. JL219SE-S6]